MCVAYVLIVTPHVLFVHASIYSICQCGVASVVGFRSLVFGLLTALWQWVVYCTLVFAYSYQSLFGQLVIVRQTKAISEKSV